jgi:hypothetical protein
VRASRLRGFFNHQANAVLPGPSVLNIESSRRLAVALAAAVGQPKAVIESLQSHGLGAALPFWSMLLAQARDARERLAAEALMTEFTATMCGCIDLPDDAFRSRFEVPNLNNLMTFKPSFGGEEHHEGQVVFDRLGQIARADSSAQGARLESVRAESQSIRKAEAQSLFGGANGSPKKKQLLEELLRPMAMATDVRRDLDAEALMPIAIANVNTRWALAFYFSRDILLDQGPSSVECDVCVVRAGDVKVGVRVPIGKRVKKWNLLASIPSLRIAYLPASSSSEAKVTMRVVGLVVATIWPRLYSILDDIE